jgi:hypothetical protein
MHFIYHVNKHNEQERAVLKSQGVEVGPVVLYFGSRSRFAEYHSKFFIFLLFLLLNIFCVIVYMFSNHC